jgi:hypothetical protein
MFNDYRWEVVVRFVDIGGIVDHHGFNVFPIINTNAYMFCQFFRVLFVLANPKICSCCCTTLLVKYIFQSHNLWSHINSFILLPFSIFVIDNYSMSSVWCRKHSSVLTSKYHHQMTIQCDSWTSFKLSFSHCQKYFLQSNIKKKNW